MFFGCLEENWSVRAEEVVGILEAMVKSDEWKVLLEMKISAMSKLRMNSAFLDYLKGVIHDAGIVV
jgi:hypothetical protein